MFVLSVIYHPWRHRSHTSTLALKRPPARLPVLNLRSQGISLACRTHISPLCVLRIFFFFATLVFSSHYIFYFLICLAPDGTLV